MEKYCGKIPAVPDALAAYLANIPKAVLAFSGGVDSSYLMYAAKACAMNFRAYYVNTQFQPQFELDDAKRLADELNADLSIIPLDVLAAESIAENPVNRCYHCKRIIFEAIQMRASNEGYTILMDGSNFSDDATDRPGMKALKELNVLSPLRDCGLTKADIRQLSKQAGIFTWNKPAYACLATRVPSGSRLTAEILKKIECAEDCLFEMGFTDFRVRILGAIAKLQFPANQIEEAARRHTEITQALSEWFGDIMLDLKPR